MTITETFQIAAAALSSVGVGGGVVLALSSYLGKIWAARILEADRAKYAAQIQELQHRLTLLQTSHQVKISHIHKERAAAVMQLHTKLADAYSGLWLFVDTCITFHDVQLAERFEARAGSFGSDLWSEVNRAQLYLSDDLLARISAFQHRMGEILNEMRPMWTYPERARAPVDDDKMHRLLAEIDGPLKDSRDEIVGVFKKILGTETD